MLDIINISSVLPSSSLSYFAPPHFISSSIFNIYYLWREMIQCWRRSRRGRDHWAGPGQMAAPHSLLCLWNAHFSHHIHSESNFQRCDLERATCCRDHLDSTLDWTQLSPVYKLLRFWQMQRSTCHSAVRHKPRM